MSNEPEKQPEGAGSPEELGPQGCRSSSFQIEGAPHHQRYREARLGVAFPVADKCGFLGLPPHPSFPEPSIGSLLRLSSLHWTEASLFTVV